MDWRWAVVFAGAGLLSLAVGQPPRGGLQPFFLVLCVMYTAFMTLVVHGDGRRPRSHEAGVAARAVLRRLARRVTIGFVVGAACVLVAEELAVHSVELWWGLRLSPGALALAVVLCAQARVSVGFLQLHLLRVRIDEDAF